MTDILKEEMEASGRILDTYPIIINEKYDADFEVMVEPARTDIREDKKFTFESELPDLEGYREAPERVEIQIFCVMSLCAEQSKPAMRLYGKRDPGDATGHNYEYKDGLTVGNRVYNKLIYEYRK